MVKYKGMKIIIISQVCYPRLTPRSHRATELAKELVRQGHKVTLYAFLGNYDYSQISESTGILFKSLGNAKYGMPSNTKGQGQKIWHRLGRIIGRPIIFPECVMIPMVKNAIKSEGEIDLLITIAVPHVIHFATSLADRSKVKNWIADCGDPFMGNPMYKLPFYFEWFERRWCKRCNYITVPVEEAINAYYSEYHDKIRVIPQGFDFENNNLAPYKKNRVPTFAYSGIFYKDLRDPSGMLDYLCTMDRDFKFVVYTKGIGLLQPYMERLKGKLEVRRIKRGANIVNGQLKITYPVDWDKTLKAWYENEEMREKKILIRDESPFLYRVQYCRNTAKFENKIFYKFALNRFIKVALKEKIKKGEIDTLW